MKSILYVILGFPMLLFGANGPANRIPRHGVGHRSAQLGAARLTVASIELRTGRARLIMRDGAGQPSTMLLQPGRRIVALGGDSMKAVSVRPGDQLELAGGNTVVDLSQAPTKLQGIVSLGPGSPDETLVVAIDGTRGIVVDVNGSTLYSDASHETTQPAQISDGDIVQLDGLLDGNLGEMTQTNAISRVAQTTRLTIMSHPGSG